MKEAIKNSIVVATALLVRNIFESEARKATRYLSPKLVISLARHAKLDRRDTRQIFVLKIGTPNVAQKDFIKKCQKAGEPFPVNKPQFQFYPKKK